MKKRDRLFVQALEAHRGYATTIQIAPLVNRTVNGASRVLGGMTALVERIGGSGGYTVWRLKNKNTG